SSGCSAKCSSIRSLRNFCNSVLASICWRRSLKERPMDDKPPAKSVDYENLEFHQLANMFPLIEGDEFDAFVDAFRRQGLLTPITLYEGKILDGRNRYRAVKKIGYKLVAKDFVDLPPGKDPREFVIAANVQRLHLTTEQKKELAIR